MLWIHVWGGECNKGIGYKTTQFDSLFYANRWCVIHINIQIDDKLHQFFIFKFISNIWMWTSFAAVEQNGTILFQIQLF